MKSLFTYLPTLLLAGAIQAQCYTPTQVIYNPNTLSAPTILTIGDDQNSGVIPIGFPFCFYGASYSSLIIGSNGVMSFDLSQANGYCPWPITSAIPSSNVPMNAIFLPWQDLYNLAGGVISYQTIGSSPSRRFVVDFDSVPMYSCSNSLFTGQVKLFETTNIIEIDIAQKTLCATWNGGYAIEGIQNSLGTSAIVIPGRNYPSQWTATNDAWSFTPSCNVCAGVGISESQISELNLFVSENNQITIIPNGNSYKLISVCNLLGQQMKFTQTENAISIEELTTGIYIINLEVNGVSVAKKVIVN